MLFDRGQRSSEIIEDQLVMKGNLDGSYRWLSSHLLVYILYNQNHISDEVGCTPGLKHLVWSS